MTAETMLPLMRAAVRFHLGLSPRQVYDAAVRGEFGHVVYRGTRLFVSERGVAEYARRAAEAPSPAGAA